MRVVEVEHKKGFNENLCLLDSYVSVGRRVCPPGREGSVEGLKDGKTYWRMERTSSFFFPIIVYFCTLE